MNNIEISTKAATFRKDFGIEQNGPIDILAVMQTIDKLSIIFYPMGERMSGLCLTNSNTPIIAINSSMSIGRQRFSMAHEIYHLYFNKANNKSACSKQIGGSSNIEKTADQFASYLLIPAVSLAEKIKILTDSTNKLQLKDIVYLEQYFKVSRQAILFRLQQDGVISDKEAEQYKHNVIKSARDLGYDDSLYKALPKDKQYGTYGYYVKIANKLLEDNLISNSKYEEFLLTAFRSDLVFGSDFEEEEIYD